MGWIIDSAASLIRLGLDAAGSRRDYLKWRTSPDGRKHFSRVESNKFYRALSEGDTQVIDTAIREKQNRIDQLKTELGMCVLACCLLSGCQTYSVPVGIPSAEVGSLKENERTYVVNNMRLRVPNEGRKTLDGVWHVVSKDFMVEHVRNQDDLLVSLSENKRGVGWVLLVVFAGVIVISCLALFCVRWF